MSFLRKQESIVNVILEIFIEDPFFFLFYVFFCHSQLDWESRKLIVILKIFYRGSSNLSSPTWLGIQTIFPFIWRRNTSWIPAIALNGKEGVCNSKEGLCGMKKRVCIRHLKFIYTQRKPYSIFTYSMYVAYFQKPITIVQ